MNKQPEPDPRLSPAMVRKLEHIIEIGFSLASKNDETLLALQRRDLVKRVGPNQWQARWQPTAKGAELAKKYYLGKNYAN